MKRLPIMVILVSMLYGCDEDSPTEPAVEPTVSINSIDNLTITFTSIEVSGEVTLDGGSQVTEKGICWSLSQNPTIDDNTAQASNDQFSIKIDELLANSTYYFRAYAMNDVGVSYSPELSANTPTLSETTWDFTIVFNETTTWHADVDFYEDGTTRYDEPESPGLFTTYGVWSLDGNELWYDLGASDDQSFYVFTGDLTENSMSGTFNWPDSDPKIWSAVLK